MSNLKPGDKVKHSEVQGEMTVVSARRSVGAVRFSTGGGYTLPDSVRCRYELDGTVREKDFPASQLSLAGAKL